MKKRALLLLSGCVVGGLLAEGLLVLAGVSFPLPYEADRYCGARLQPGFRGYWSKEGAAHFTVNSAGFRDREHARRKPADVIRVAVLGDSYIEALQVPLESMFASILERELNQKVASSGQRFEVLSFGISGFGTAQELLMLRHHVWQFEPDIVLLACLPANDVRNNSRELEPQKVRPFFELVDGKLEPDFSFRSDPAFEYSLSRSFRIKTDIINASRIIQVVRAIRDGEVFTRQEVSRDEGNQPISRDQIGLDDQAFIGPKSEVWKSAWILTERLIEQMDAECRRRQCAFAVSVITSGIQVNPDDALRRQYAERLGVDDLNYADRRLVRLGERHGFPVIPLSTGLLAFAKEHQTYVHGFANTRRGEGHWNSAGHREAAIICSERLWEMWKRRSSETESTHVN